MGRIIISLTIYYLKYKNKKLKKKYKYMMREVLRMEYKNGFGGNKNER